MWCAYMLALCCLSCYGALCAATSQTDMSEDPFWLGTRDFAMDSSSQLRDSVTLASDQPLLSQCEQTLWMDSRKFYHISYSPLLQSGIIIQSLQQHLHNRLTTATMIWMTQENAMLHKELAHLNSELSGLRESGGNGVLLLVPPTVDEEMLLPERKKQLVWTAYDWKVLWEEQKKDGKCDATDFSRRKGEQVMGSQCRIIKEAQRQWFQSSHQHHLAPALWFNLPFKLLNEYWQVLIQSHKHSKKSWRLRHSDLDSGSGSDSGSDSEAGYMHSKKSKKGKKSVMDKGKQNTAEKASTVETEVLLQGDRSMSYPLASIVITTGQRQAPGLDVPPAPLIILSKITPIAPMMLLDMPLDQGLGMLIVPSKMTTTAPDLLMTPIMLGMFSTALLNTPLDRGLSVPPAILLKVPPALGPIFLSTLLDMLQDQGLSNMPALGPNMPTTMTAPDPLTTPITLGIFLLMLLDMPQDQELLKTQNTATSKPQHLVIFWDYTSYILSVSASTTLKKPCCTWTVPNEVNTRNKCTHDWQVKNPEEIQKEFVVYFHALNGDAKTWKEQAQAMKAGALKENLPAMKLGDSGGPAIGAWFGWGPGVLGWDGWRAGGGQCLYE
ncbi:hypothetical protein OE88DRAFT_1647310 [Heliocybe sulcata]|uniref:Uncharacterized protein n=1 Tax=Heliocybe sulcata TaxID=5364 RepID=A0A5C3MTK2_9AGAM|nr:hypothetical protein OE88DRAFT_1647310 [Heliocybe sulcata]